MIENCW